MVTSVIVLFLFNYISIPLGLSLPSTVYSLGAVVTYICSTTFLPHAVYANPWWHFEKWYRALQWILVGLWLAFYTWFSVHYIVNSDMPLSVLALECIIVSLILMIWKTNLSFYIIHKPWAIQKHHRQIMHTLVFACAAELYLVPFKLLMVSERLMLCSELLINLSLCLLTIALLIKGYVEYIKPQHWWSTNNETPKSIWGPVDPLAEGLRYYVIRFIMLGHKQVDNIDIVGMTHDKPDFLALPWWRKQLSHRLPNIDQIYKTIGPEGTLLMLTHCELGSTQDASPMELPANLL